MKCAVYVSPIYYKVLLVLYNNVHMKKTLHTLVFASLILLGGIYMTFPTPSFATSSTNVSISDIVEMLITLDIIPSDKAEAARTIVKEKTGTDETKTSYCVHLMNNLYLGKSDDTTGGEVSKLQEFLKNAGVYEYPKITGYFGPATEIAVQKWQKKMGILSSGTAETNGFGVIGPKSRSKMLCAVANKEMKQERNENKEKKLEDDESDDEDENEDEDKDDDSNEDSSGDVTSITLESDDDDADKVRWDVNGHSEKGFKVVWSLNEGPTYPTRSGDKYLYYSNPEADSATLTAFKGSGEYHVRVCEYLGGACGKYSNEITVEL